MTNVRLQPESPLPRNFARVPARQTGKPFYVQPSPWHMGTVPSFLPGDEDTTNEWCKERGVPVRNGAVTVEVPPGEVRIVELIIRD